VAGPRNALKKREKVRAFTLGLTGPTEEFPWGETVAETVAEVKLRRENRRPAPNWLSACSPTSCIHWNTFLTSLVLHRLCHSEGAG
jgi:hypothetical protein